jgi:hypothetical protein
VPIFLPSPRDSDEHKNVKVDAAVAAPMLKGVNPVQVSKSDQCDDDDETLELFEG